MIKNIVAHLEAVLEALDALAGECDEPEALEDLNAEFEDTLMMLSEINPREDGWQEELSDALEDLRSLAADYRRTGIPGVEALAGKLEAAAQG
jgi:hypothetical protein